MTGTGVLKDFHREVFILLIHLALASMVALGTVLSAPSDNLAGLHMCYPHIDW